MKNDYIVYDGQCLDIDEGIYFTITECFDNPQCESKETVKGLHWHIKTSDILDTFQGNELFDVMYAYTNSTVIAGYDDIEVVVRLHDTDTSIIIPIIPEYYNQGIETLEYIESWGMNFARGNIIKYVTRAGLKNPDTELEDLKKAQVYLSREIERVKNNEHTGTETS